MTSDEGGEPETRREIPATRDTLPPATKPAATAFDPKGERFELGEELGRGGMGRVVAATDRALAREVAIKQALTDDERALARFEREVRITARLEHPSIVAIHDAGRDRTGRPYYVMRRLEGEHLSDRVEAATTARERLALVPNVLAAVDAAAFAHARNIIHRDIKPWNILVGAYGETLLIDWGLAREIGEAELPAQGGDVRDSALTRAGGVFGTPGYMAPEQARGEQADQRADVFALGATLFHVLTGKSALGSSSATAWLERVSGGSAVQLGEFPAEVPRELVAIVAKAMADDRSARYRDAGELAADLRAFLAGQLVAAHHYTRRERLARFIRKHRVALAIGAAALITVGVVATISIGNVIDERDLARAAREDAERERGIANERSEVMLLDRATTLTATDPTRAVALIRQLPPTSKHMARARDITETASHRGIGKGLATRLGNVNVLEFTRDGKSLVAAGESGDIYVIDLATGDHKIFAAGVKTSAALLLDDQRLLVGSYEDGVFVIDLRTGAKQVLDAKVRPTNLWRVDDDRIRFFDAIQKTVGEYSFRTGGQRTLATGVATALSIGEHLVIGDGTQLRLLGGPREVVLPGATAVARSPIWAVNATSDRFAFASLDDVIEWDLAGTETRRWQLPIATSMQYAADGILYASSRSGILMALERSRMTEVTRGTGSIWWRTPLRNGAAFLDPDGKVYVMVGWHFLQYSFDHPRSRTIRASADSRHLAVGSADGTVRWFDTSLMVPESYTSPRGTQACFIDKRYVFAAAQGELIRIERSTGARKTLIDYDQGPPFVCQGKFGHLLALGSGLGTHFVDIDTGTFETTSLVGFVDEVAQRYVHVRGREIVDYEPITKRERVVWTAPDEIPLMATRGPWLVAAAGGMLHRIERRTGRDTKLAIPITTFSIAADGTIAYVHDDGLWEWRGDATRRLVKLPGTTDTIYGVTGGWAVRLKDGSLWLVDGTTISQRASANRLDFLGFGPKDFAWRLHSYNRLFRIHLVTGEQVVMTLPLKMVTRSSPTLALAASDDALFVIEDRVPDDPARLFGWIDATTNGYLDATNALLWRGSPR